MRSLVVAPLLAALAGCLPLNALDPYTEQPNLSLVPASPFGTPGAMSVRPARASYTPANSEVSVRVAQLGNKLLQANPEIGMKPLFATAGTTGAEIFHNGDQMVHVTEGLVKKCPTDGVLAALLAFELAEMVAEREVLAHPSMRRGEDRPPPEVRVGNAGQFNEADMTRLVELANFEKRREEKRNKPLPLPDPQELAGRYLEKAGFQKSDLDAAAPLLREAEQNYALEKQFRQAPPAQWQWSPQPQAGQAGAAQPANGAQPQPAHLRPALTTDRLPDEALPAATGAPGPTWQPQPGVPASGTPASQPGSKQ